MKAVLVLTVLLSASGCASELSTEELVAALTAKGITVGDGFNKRSQVQKEFDNLNEALASGVPMPRLEKKLVLDGVPTDLYFCPGKAEQARKVVAYLLGGPRPSDSKLMAMTASVITGDLNIPFESHIVSMRPEREHDEAVLKIAVALAAIEAR